MRAVANVDADSLRLDERSNQDAQRGQNAIEGAGKTDSLASRPRKPGRGVRFPFRRHAEAQLCWSFVRKIHEANIQRPTFNVQRPTSNAELQIRVWWFQGAQAASLQLPAACRQHFSRSETVSNRSVSASCRDEQAGSPRRLLPGNLSRAEHYLFERNWRCIARLGDCCLRLWRRVISMAGDALGHDFSSWTVAGDAARFRRHQHVGSVAALQRLMATVAIERLLRMRIDSMLGVIEVCLRQPAVHQDWPRDHGRRVWDWLHLVTKRAPSEVCSSDNVCSLLRLFTIG